MDFVRRHNNALDINPPNANRKLSEHGSNWLWALTAVFGITLLSWLAWTLLRYKSRTVPRQSKHVENGNAPVQVASTAVTPAYRERIFHYLWSLAAFIGLITYFTMASDLGNTPVRQYLHHGSNPAQTRQVFYVRYIYWALAWPLIITANLILSGVSWATIFFAIALQEIWVVSWLCGALVATSYKWGYFAFGLFAYLILAYVMMAWGAEHARRIGTNKSYTMLAGILVVAWLAFPVCWALSEGANRLSITGEMIFYGILDLIAVPVYGSLWLLMSRKFSPRLNHFTQEGRVTGIDHHAETALLAGGPHGHHESGVPVHNGV
jgi:bacteriorhodopsin